MRMLPLLLTLVVSQLASPLAYCDGAKHLYLVAKPITIEAKLGTTAKVAYHALPGIESAVKVGLLYASSGQPIAAIGLGLFEGSKALLSTRIYSTLDLKARVWYSRRKPLEKLKQTPGVERMLMLTAANFKYFGIAATSVVAQSYIFLESSEPLDLKQSWNEELGELVEVTDLDQTRVRMNLIIDGDRDPVVWNTSLHEIFEHASMPEEVAQSWGVAMAAHDTVQSVAKRHVTKAHEELVTVNATLVFANGVEQELGSLIQANGLHKLLGHGIWVRTKTWWRAFWGTPTGPTGDLPVSSVRCENILTKP